MAQRAQLVSLQREKNCAFVWKSVHRKLVIWNLEIVVIEHEMNEFLFDKRSKFHDCFVVALVVLLLDIFVVAVVGSLIFAR